MADSIKWKGSSFLEELERRSKAKLSACLQCYKCSSGCPMGEDMDLCISQIIRLCQLGAVDEVLQSKTVWLCASCEACASRCPMEISGAALFDALRMISIERNIPLADKKAMEFNRSFMDSIQKRGRVFELGMLAAYKLRSKDLFSDMDKAMKLLKRGKLSILPKKSKSAADVKKAFKKAKGEEDGSR